MRFVVPHVHIPLLKPPPQCEIADGDTFLGIVKRSSTIWAVILILISNRLLLEYLFVVKGEYNETYPNDRPAALFIAFGLFVSLILLYAALYFMHLPCLHFIYRDRPLGYRVISDMVTNAYLSTVTITTLGYGDMSPKNHLWAEIFASIEAINGLFAFGGLVTVMFELKPRAGSY